MSASSTTGSLSDAGCGLARALDPWRSSIRKAFLEKNVPAPAIFSHMTIASRSAAKCQCAVFEIARVCVE